MSLNEQVARRIQDNLAMRNLCGQPEMLRNEPLNPWPIIRDSWLLPTNTFIDTVYNAILARPADDTGKPHFEAEINKGMPRSHFVLALLHSEEAQRLSLVSDWIPNMYSLEASTPLHSLDWLLQLTDEKLFITICYIRLLGRKPSDAEIVHWRRRMRLFLIKRRTRMIKSLMQSPERYDLIRREDWLRLRERLDMHTVAIARAQKAMEQIYKEVKSIRVALHSVERVGHISEILGHENSKNLARICHTLEQIQQSNIALYNTDETRVESNHLGNKAA